VHVTPTAVSVHGASELEQAGAGRVRAREKRRKAKALFLPYARSPGSVALGDRVIALANHLLGIAAVVHGVIRVAG